MEPVHMIDADSNFCQGNVDSIIKSSAGLSAPDAPYAVVSIVGAQSSGKSFLMNCLFGTKFPVMDAKFGRSQTSRGIMISSCIQPSLVLLDVEGFDGREQGEDTLFEKRAALFALVVSDLMMINMAISDIGREQGGATPLFRTIFQERTKLPPGITKLLIVIRFYDGETPLELLRRDVLKSMEKIWESVNMESAKFKEYIEVSIVALRDKKSHEFPKEVTILRNLISNNRSAKGPASGFSHSSSMYWETIKGNKDLDIPTQRVALARLYCRQLIEDTIISLNSSEEFKLLKAEKSHERFEKISHELLENIMAGYDLKTEKYDTEVRNNERQLLEERLHKAFQNVAEEIKARAKKKKDRLINLAISGASFTGGLIYSLVTGDFVHPVVRTARPLIRFVI